MFDSGSNIQGWPTPTLFVSRGNRELFNFESVMALIAHTGGNYMQVVVDGGAFDIGTVAVALGITGGAYSLVVVDGGSFNTDELAVNLAHTGGIYLLVVVDAGVYAETLGVSLAFSGGEYDSPLVPVPTISETPLVVNVAHTGGAYVHI